LGIKLFHQFIRASIKTFALTEESPSLTLIMSNEKKLKQKRFHSVSTENTAEQNAEKESIVN
jgi:hypothetical protein